jgi:predicted O-methyltransferase YrrM
MAFNKLFRAAASISSLLSKTKELNGQETPEQLVAMAMESPVIAPQQIPSEFNELARLVKEKDCQRILEIGTYRGGTLFVFSRLSQPDATIISVDYSLTFHGKIVRSLQPPLFRRIMQPRQKLSLLRADSHSPETLKKIESILNGAQLDFLFIDGDHRYEGVKQDFDMYSPLVRAGGLVAFHDIARTNKVEEVYRFWGEVKQRYSHREFVHRTDDGAMGIGVLQL